MYVKNEFLISIIVPVYNVEMYIDDCISQLINQSYKNIEIILVDDGSTDMSAYKCDKWKEKDDRIKTIHQKNCGASVARNKGLELANGTYVIFVDADDIVSLSMCDILLTCALSNDADIVMSEYLQVLDKRNIPVLCESEFHQSCTLMNQGEAVLKITDVHYKPGINAVTKLYRADIAKKHHFKVGYPLGEDQAYVFACMCDAHRICYTNQITYFYITRDGSAVNRAMTEEMACKLVRLYDDILTECQGKIDHYNRIVAYRVLQCELTILNRCDLESKDNKLLLQIQQNLKRYVNKIYKSGYPINKVVQIFFARYFTYQYIKIYHWIK